MGSSSKSSCSSPTVKVLPQKLRRNERERKRVDQVNQGFNELRERVPRKPGCKQKMSKVDTLREAVRYIQILQEQLGYVPPPTSSSSLCDFPTPENSPNYPLPLIPKQEICSSGDGSSSSSSSTHSGVYTHNHYSNNVSPFYPPPNYTADSGLVQNVGNFSQLSPGSNSFYSDASYDDQFMH